jgi:hypothetical protein
LHFSLPLYMCHTPKHESVFGYIEFKNIFLRNMNKHHIYGKLLE